MPAVIPSHSLLRMRLKDAAQAALAFSQRLESAVAVKTAQPSGVTRGRVDHSQPPWNAAAADAILGLHARARATEKAMRRNLGFACHPRGSSQANTAKALEAVIRLAEACDDDSVRDEARWLDAWCRRAAEILGDAESARRLPRAHGRTAPACPWCKGDTLRQRALEGTVACIDPSCRDDEGRRPVAVLEYFRDDFALRWQDGVVSGPWA